MGGTKPKGSKNREFPFAPRVINPAPIAHVVIFSAEEAVRKEAGVLEKEMPWLTVHHFSDPLSVSAFQSDKPVVFLLDDMSLSFVDTDRIRENNRDGVIVLLSASDVVHRSPPAVAEEKHPHIRRADLIFAINDLEFRPSRILPAAVRAAEDLININKYSRARRYIFLIVDDEPRWFSQFLPVLYKIIGQRAAVRLTRTYEETLRFLFGVEHEEDIDEEEFFLRGRGDDVVCLITDVFFPQGDLTRTVAGVDLIKLIHRFYPRIPAIIASKAKEAEGQRDKAFILPKGDPEAIQIFRDYIYDYTGMGDFILSRRDGSLIRRIKHVGDLYDIILEAEKETEEAEELRSVLEEYGRRDYFSTWFYMHGFRKMADELRPRRDRGRRLISVLKRHLQREMIKTSRTPLLLGELKIHSLSELREGLKTAKPENIQRLSDSDVFSTWLEQNCYPELAEELRPIHGSGEPLRDVLIGILDLWLPRYSLRVPPSE